MGEVVELARPSVPAYRAHRLADIRFWPGWYRDLEAPTVSTFMKHELSYVVLPQVDDVVSSQVEDGW